MPLANPAAANLYEHDFLAWTVQQARLLRSRRLTAIDAENIAEEIEAMGRSERRELENRLAVLLAHLLKWQAQPSRRSNSWRLTVKEQRQKLYRLLAGSPSLSAHHAVAEAYSIALTKAQKQTGLAEDAFPPACPWDVNLVLAKDWFPTEQDK
jgi:hypothetical protein